MYCSFCGSNKHTIKNCPKTHGGSCNRNNMYCSYCGSQKHDIEGCPKTHAGSAHRAWHPDSISDHFIED